MDRESPAIHSRMHLPAPISIAQRNIHPKDYSNDVLMKFAETCLMDPVRNVDGWSYLEFLHGTLDMENRFQQAQPRICIRSCYDHIYNKMMEVCNPSIIEPQRRVFMLGTPGIGKTMFRNFVAHKLLRWAHHTKARMVLVFQVANDMQTDFHVVMFDIDRIASAETYAAVDKEVVQRLMQRKSTEKTCVVSLTDVGEGAWKNAIDCDHHFFFTSPNTRIFQSADRLKEMRGAVDLWMPLWHLDELLSARLIMYGPHAGSCGGFDGHPLKYDPSTNGPSEALLRRRVETYGRTARVAFDPLLKDTLVKFDRAKHQAEWRMKALEKMEEGRLELLGKASHSFIHADVLVDSDGRGNFEYGGDEREDTFRVPKIKFASSYVRSALADIALEHSFDQLLSTSTSESSPGVKGELVETMLLAIIKHIIKNPKGRNSRVAVQLSKDPEGMQPQGAEDASAKQLHALLTSGMAYSEEWCSKTEMKTRLISVLGSIESNTAVMLRPYEPTMAAVDAVLLLASELDEKWCLFLQVTINSTHSVAGADAAMYLNDLAGVSDDVRLSLIYVVPECHFWNPKSKEVKWTRQSIRDGYPAASALVQYAMCVGLVNSTVASAAISKSKKKLQKNTQSASAGGPSQSGTKTKGKR